MKVEPSILEKWHYFAKSKQMHLSDVIKRLMNAEELPETVPLKKPPKRNYVAPQRLKNQLSARENSKKL